MKLLYTSGDIIESTEEIETVAIVESVKLNKNKTYNIIKLILSRLTTMSVKDYAFHKLAPDTAYFITLFQKGSVIVVTKAIEIPKNIDFVRNALEEADNSSFEKV